MPSPPVLVTLVRDGIVESEHRGHLVVVDASGGVLSALGDQDWPTYVRSAAKPFQALATLDLLDQAGVSMAAGELAVACASHIGTDTHQIEAAFLLARADLDESALLCPPALPAHLPTMLDQRSPTSLAHNCSGKHAAFLLAHTATGEDPATYLDVDAPLQQRVAEHLAAVCDAQLAGPGVDGCGAPAWVMPLSGLAIGFARLAEGATPALARVRDAMRTHPYLVGGDTADTALMLADERVVAKRGAEAVLAAGVELPTGPVGVAVKVADGSHRAAAPALAAALVALGCTVPDSVLAETILGGGHPHGTLTATPEITATISR